jgi:hypothetical protein
MSPLALALRARHFFPHASRSVCARQAVAYAKAIQFLGDRWILARPSQRLAEPRPV